MTLDVFADETNKISLALTVVFLLYLIELCQRWFPAVALSIQERRNDADAKLGKGIFFGFLFNGFDNLYWFIAWVTVLYDMASAEMMLAMGCMFNIVFRQGGGIYAINEHIEAAHMIHNANKPRRHWHYWLAGLVSYIGFQVVHIGLS